MVLRVGLLAAALFLTGPEALACTCLCDLPDSEEPADDAVHIFRGEVTSVKRRGAPLDDGYQIFEIAVEKWIKGKPASVISLYSPMGGGGLCGVAYDRGDKVNVFALREKDGKLWTSSCALYCARDPAFKALEAGQ